MLKGQDVFVPGHRLKMLVNEATVKGPLHLLQKLVPLVFSVEELAQSCGQGLSASVNTNGESKTPLEPTKTKVLKGKICNFWLLTVRAKSRCQGSDITATIPKRKVKRTLSKM